MSDYRQSGFTIVEVILFLAISSALAIAVLVGTSASINQARYRDTTVSLQSELQDQFRAAMLVYNSNRSQICENGSLRSANGMPVYKGSSECVVLGRLVAIAGSGTSIESRSVIGYVSDNILPESRTSDLEALKEYSSIRALDGEVETYEVPWEATITRALRDEATPGAGLVASDTRVYILLLRSPVTNKVVSFVWAGEADLKEVVDGSDEYARASERSIKLCVQSSDFLAGGNRGVFVRPSATVAGDVLEIGDAEENEVMKC